MDMRNLEDYDEELELRLEKEDKEWADLIKQLDDFFKDDTKQLDNIDMDYIDLAGLSSPDTKNSLAKIVVKGLIELERNIKVQEMKEALADLDMQIEQFDNNKYVTITENHPLYGDVFEIIEDTALHLNLEDSVDQFDEEIQSGLDELEESMFIEHNVELEKKIPETLNYDIQREFDMAVLEELKEISRKQAYEDAFNIPIGSTRIDWQTEDNISVTSNYNNYIEEISKYDSLEELNNHIKKCK